MGYVPNAAARTLRSRRTEQIAFAMPDVGNPVYASMVDSIQEVARARGLRLLLHSTGADAEDELAMVRDLKHRYVDGLILASLHLTDAHADELRRAAAPVILIGRPTKGTPSDSVRAYSRKGAAEAVRHLHAAGRRRIAFINGPPAHSTRCLAPPRLSRRPAVLRNRTERRTVRGRRRLHDRARSQGDQAIAGADEAGRDLLRERPARDRRAVGAARGRARRPRRRGAGGDGQHDAGGGHVADADLGRPRLGRAGADGGRAAAGADRRPVGRAAHVRRRAAPRRPGLVGSRPHDRRPRGRTAGAAVAAAAQALASPTGRRCCC